MKKSIFLLLTAVVVLAGCSKNNNDKRTEPKSNAVSFAGTTDADKTRVSYEIAGSIKPSWVKGDRIGIFADSESVSLGANIAYKAMTAGTRTSFEIVPGEEVIEWAGETAEHEFYAYYPYAAGSGVVKTAVAVSLPAAQTQTDSGLGHLAGCDFMYASAKNVTKDDGAVEFGFEHLFSVLEVKLIADGGVAQVNSITFSCDDVNEAVAFDGTFNLANPAAGVTVTDATKSNSVTLTFTPALIVTETSTSAFMMISPGHEGKSFKVYADVENEDDPVLIATRDLGAGQSIPAGKKAVIVADAIDASGADMTIYDKLLGTWTGKNEGSDLDYTMTFAVDEYQKSYKVILDRADFGENHPLIAEFKDGKVAIWNRQEMGTKDGGTRFISAHYNGTTRENPDGTLIFSIEISWEATPVFNADGSITLAFADDGKTDYIAKSLNLWNCGGNYFSFGSGSNVLSWTELVLSKSGMGGTVKDFEEWVWE